MDPDAARPVTRGLRDFRLHCIGGVRHRDSDEALRRLAAMAERGPAWVMFNTY